MSYKNTKRDTVKALLRSDTMSKIIKDALESPVGSTPRKRAQKIVSIMKKMQKNDGAGGPGVVVPGYTGPVPMVPGVKKKKVRGHVRVFQAPPKMRTTQEIMDGAGGPGLLSFAPASYTNGIYGPVKDYSSMSSSSSAPAAPAQKDYGLVGKIPGAVSSLATGAAKGLMYGGSSLLGAGQYAVQNTSKAMSDYNKVIAGDLVPGVPYGYTSYGDTKGAKYASGLLPGNTTQSGSTSQSGPISPAQRLLDSINGKGYQGMYPGSSITSEAYRLSGGANVGTSGADTSGGTYGQDGLPSGFEESYGDSTFGGGSSPSTAWGGMYGNVSNDTLRGSLESSMGSGMFALSAMGDINKLKSLPGFENVPDDYLPWGADLSGQLDFLHETLNREIGVDKAMDELELSFSSYEDFVNGGVGLTERLTDYVRRRDEFLNETTGMITDFKGKLLDGSIDTYNPVVAKQAESYLGYLSTLQGRQSKRYVDWVNQSTSVYGQQLEASANLLQQRKDMYQIKSNELKDRYASGEKIALTEYNLVYSALQEMYTTAAAMPMQQAQLEALQSETYFSAAKAAQDALGSTENFDMLSPESQAAYKFLTEQLIDKETGAFREGQRNISSMLLSFSGGANDSNSTEIVMEVYKNNIGKDFAGVDAEVATQRAMAHYQGIAEFQKMWADQINNSSNFTPEEKQMALANLSNISSGLAKSVTNPFIDSVTNGLKQDAEKSQTLKQAVESLTNPRRFMGMAKGEVPSKDEFLKKFSGKLPGQLLSSVYNSYTQFINSDEQAASSPWMFYAGPVAKDPGISTMSNDEFVNNVMKNTYYGLSQYNPGFM